VKFINAAEALGREPVHDLLRVISMYSVYHGKEVVENSDIDPIPLLCDLFERNALFLKGGETAIPHLNLPAFKENFETVEKITGEHYGNLFSDFDDYHYFEEPVKLLRDRFELNGLLIKEFQGQKALDAGCGGGRYTNALKKIGFGEVVGIDISDSGLENCRARIKEKGIEGISYKEGTALDLPFDDETFDFVFSNGVLHHTEDLVKGIHELLRVLKKGGSGFLYLVENPGGIHWDVIEILRCVMKDVDIAYARAVFKILGVPPNRRYFILDHIMVPINIRSTCEEIEGWLRDSGVSEFRRLTRGTSFDKVEKIFQKEPFAEVKFGIGEQRYFFKK
jgi:ubiquinone/menaquinone biosynthesis C-methylase UbiE